MQETVSHNTRQSKIDVTLVSDRKGCICKVEPASSRLKLARGRFYFGVFGQALASSQILAR